MSDFYRNPPAAYPPSGSARTTVPGWGALPIAAGPARLAVGAITPRYVVSQERQEAWVPPAERSAIPWWVWVAAPGALVGVAALAVNQGWIGGG